MMAAGSAAETASATTGLDLSSATHGGSVTKDTQTWRYVATSAVRDQNLLRMEEKKHYCISQGQGKQAAG